MKNSLIVAVVTLILLSCNSSSKQQEQNVPTYAVPSQEPAQYAQPYPNISPLDTIIGVPMSVSYAIPQKSWNLSLDVSDKNGYAYNVEIDSATAMQILQDKSGAKVKIIPQRIVLLPQKK